ncbi:Dabb family protein [Cupriavidus sp. UYPR2.512]|uniref:Dabb family protein n=1 Tax=Cupriavidus sp. UYPR2.512 TaxID=1080187 RepID=UPI0009DB361E|nr:Dabb family protein [Cupriavidus sp. UYPR2.512]UIF90015.1 Dabb family protein [Cupriavidus necator]
MIKHIVMWRVRGDTLAERESASRLVKNRFESLRGLIPGMRHLEIGLDSSRVDYACDVVLMTEFESREALEAYAVHPEHLRVRNELGDLRTARFQVDYAIDGSRSLEESEQKSHAKV